MNSPQRLLCTTLLTMLALPAWSEALRVAGDRLFVPITIEGVAAEALLDSGAEMTLIDTAFAERLGLMAEAEKTARGTGGEAMVQFAHGVDLASVGVYLQNLTAAVLDLGDISRRLVGEPVHVVLGRELFDAGRFHVDIEGGSIDRLNDDPAPAGTELPLRDHSGIKQLPVQIEGVETWADLDLGNGSEMLLGQPFAAEQGWLDAGRIVGTGTGGGLGGEVVRDLVRLASVRIAGRELGPVVAAIHDSGHAADANVGVSLLRHFTLVIDFPGNRIWLTPATQD